MDDGGIRGHGANRSANGIQIAVGGIARGGPGLSLGGDKRGQKQNAGGETTAFHDYRVCPISGQKSTLDARGDSPQN